MIFNLQDAPWHLFVQPVSLSLTFSPQDSIEQWFCLPKVPTIRFAHTSSHRDTSTDGWYKMLCFSFFEISCLSLEILVGGVGLWQGVFAYISYIYIKIYR